jgi:sortase A
MTPRAIRWIEVVLVVVGVVCIGYVASAVVETRWYQARENRLLDATITAAAAQKAVQGRTTLPSTDAARKAPAAGEAIGRIDIPRLGISAVVRHGEDDKTLKVAVGHLPGTPRPGKPGNSVLAAHRDTFFRPLENVRQGDQIVMTVPQGKYFFSVTKTHVVDPKDVWVMNPTEASVLTLVTCYPFSYVGNAPRRFIVHAAKVSESLPPRGAAGTPSRSVPGP